jgi:deoxyribose-phosphate aldolase
MNRKELAGLLDHTMLNPAATYADVERVCREAAENGFAACALLPRNVALAARILSGTRVAVCAAISYPLGLIPAAFKAREAADALAKGADELDYVVNVGAIKDGGLKALAEEAALMVSAGGGKVVKAILEIPCLSRAEAREAARVVAEEGVAFVKSSTGYKGLTGMRPTTSEDVRLMVEAVSGKARVKAAGGISTFDQVIELVDAGAERIGTSSGLAILAGYRDVTDSR